MAKEHKDMPRTDVGKEGEMPKSGDYGKQGGEKKEWEGDKKKEWETGDKKPVD